MKSYRSLKTYCLWAATWLLAATACAFAGPEAAEETDTVPDINPYPRAVLSIERLHGYTFDAGTEGWRALNHSSVEARDGRLVITTTGGHPYLDVTVPPTPGPLSVKLRYRAQGGGSGQFFWGTEAAPGYAPERAVGFPMIHDGDWHEATVGLTGLDEDSVLTSLRFDPGSAPGTIELDGLELFRGGLHPLEIVKIMAQAHRIDVQVMNHGEAQLPVTLGPAETLIQPGGMQTLTLAPAGGAPFRTVPLRLESEDLPPIEREVAVFDDPPTRRPAGALRGPGYEFWPGQGGGWVMRGGQAVAVVTWPVEPARLTIDRNGDLIVNLDADDSVEGPVLRVLGDLEQGLFAGLEFLGKGERSSSKLDIETDEHLRYAPDKMDVTMPLMAVVTDRAAAAMTWSDMTLQPVFASPNFFDGGPDHRMALRGRRINTRIRVLPPDNEPLGTALADLILWSVDRLGGLPPLPRRPRNNRAQFDLALASLNGPIEAGDDQPNTWGHCAELNWERRPFADMASTIWRLTGDVRDLGEVVPGGAHIRNDSYYFITGRAGVWLQNQQGSARGLMDQQSEEGLFTYDGPYRRGHFENTASGYAGGRARQLLEYAQMTGDEQAKAAGLRALEAMMRFRTPRGYQIWELSLHTPDIMASGYAADAYLRGYELTGDQRYLERARYWAITGIPFVYLWSNQPVMMYATIPVYGATNFRAPNWIGLPVQWCGITYADCLLRLAKHDRTLDWHKLAEGILISAEQQQHPDGPFIGTLPDSFTLESQSRNGPMINPCAMVSLRYSVEGREAGLSWAEGDGHRVVAPFPVRIDRGEAVMQGQAGLTYQIVVDGRRVVEVNSQGTDRVPL